MRAVISFILGATTMTLAGIYISQASFLPYNVRELVYQQSPVLSSVGLSLSVYWCFGFPVWIAIYCMRQQDPWVKARSLIILYLFHCILTGGLLIISVPLESIHDIVGSPVLDMRWKWELLGRLIGFFGIFSLLFCAAAILSAWQYHGYRENSRQFLPLSFLMLLFLALSYLIVIPGAATNNITELMAGGGGVQASVFISLGIFVWALAGGDLSILFLRGVRHINPHQIILILISLPLIYLCLSFGLEPKLHKYGQEFSALQFLLSSDRKHLVTGAELLWRLSIAHFFFLGLIGFVQYPFWFHAFYYRGTGIRFSPRF